MKTSQSLEQQLRDRPVLLGLLQAYPNTVLAEIAGLCGYDFLLLDDEHGLFDKQDYLNTIHTLAAIELAAWVRVRSHDPRVIGRYLDMGVDAIVAPSVSTAEEAHALVRAMLYPPTGTRGMGAGLHRVTHYGQSMSTHLKKPREGTALIVIIESARGVANVDDILAVQGVDAVVIGPSDLSANLGCPGEFSRPEYAAAVRRIEQSASTHGKPLGTSPHGSFSLEKLVNSGHRLIILGADIPLIREAMSSLLASARGCLTS